MSSQTVSPLVSELAQHQMVFTPSDEKKSELTKHLRDEIAELDAIIPTHEQELNELVMQIKELDKKPSILADLCAERDLLSSELATRSDPGLESFGVESLALKGAQNRDAFIEEFARAFPRASREDLIGFVEKQYGEELAVVAEKKSRGELLDKIKKLDYAISQITNCYYSEANTGNNSFKKAEEIMNNMRAIRKLECERRVHGANSSCPCEKWLKDKHGECLGYSCSLPISHSLVKELKGMRQERTDRKEMLEKFASRFPLLSLEFLKTFASQVEIGRRSVLLPRFSLFNLDFPFTAVVCGPCRDYNSLEEKTQKRLYALSDPVVPWNFSNEKKCRNYLWGDGFVDLFGDCFGKSGNNHLDFFCVQFPGVIPQKSRGVIREFQREFPEVPVALIADIGAESWVGEFYQSRDLKAERAEAARLALELARDPLTVALVEGFAFLIDSFDVTQLEHYVMSEFMQQPKGQ